MIEVVIPANPIFYKYEKSLRELYEKYQDKICDKNSFDFICYNTLFYLFLVNGQPIGAIYYFVDDEGKLFLNGFSIRKSFEDNIKCLKLSTTWFKCDIYAEAQNRASAICLLRGGFKRVENNLFVYKKS